MHAQDLVVDQGSYRQAVEAVGEDFPQLDTVAALALVIEAVNAIDRGALVVAAQQEKVLWVLYFVGQKEADCLERLLSSINVVTQEQIVGVWREPTVLKETEQVVVLSMYIAYLRKDHT